MEPIHDTANMAKNQRLEADGPRGRKPYCIYYYPTKGTQQKDSS